MGGAANPDNRARRIARVKSQYFYLNDQLHMKLRIDRPRDRITTWCYPLGARVIYTYSDVKRDKKPVFTMHEVADMLNRHMLTIERAILNESIPRPQFTYGFTEKKGIKRYLFSEQDVLNMHELLINTNRGRPRPGQDPGNINVPTLRELRALMRNEEVMYVKREDGEFVPVWKAKDFG